MANLRTELLAAVANRHEVTTSKNTTPLPIEEDFTADFPENWDLITD
jgi:hypothetical protein